MWSGTLPCVAWLFNCGTQQNWHWWTCGRQYLLRIVFLWHVITMNSAVLTQMGFTELIIAPSLFNNADERPGGILLPYSVHIYILMQWHILMAKPLAACLTKRRMCRHKLMFVVKIRFHLPGRLTDNTCNYDDVIKWKKKIRVSGPLCGEFTGHRLFSRKKASDAELWCFLWPAPE